MARRVLWPGFHCRLGAGARRETAAPIVGAGASLAENPEALARACDVIATIVGGPDDVSELHRRMAPVARPGTVFVDMTTASAGQRAESGELAALAGAFAIDAPVTGGRRRDAGRADVVRRRGRRCIARACPVLQAFRKRIVPCGAPGPGYG
ncbi:MAG: NAD(P)-dependent oxidoreductase [Betaproteobacteria bacterium]|nr:NAD(P)-dependent oxidoreductase [Betaproteobacteria bacterium]